MADWLKNPWIEKAIYSFYDKDATQPSRAKAQIIQVISAEANSG